MAATTTLRVLTRRLAAVLPVALIGLSGLGSPGRAADATSTAGGKGAQVYCFMRSAGNSHDVSWNAAYALIKRQSASMFKTSPEHAAVMITEAVVQNPGSFPDCGRYLGSLFEKAAARDAAAGAAPSPSTTTSPAGGAGSGSAPQRTDRYAY
ncbi:MAG: penicillin amidase [Synechococcaceae bacterium WB8_1B_136]|nr:penicillin amidase [Synechococcaceae bacterium WB8_1B_136]